MPARADERAWDGNEWQDYAQLLLKHHYGAAYQEVPDGHGGDFGLEGYSSSDATVYQCYAPQGYVDTNTLYERQRDKMTADLTKFVQNRSDLAALFGGLKIRRWILLVPQHSSAKLVQHATKKADEIRALALPYVSDDFEVRIATDDHFSVARAQLVTAGIHSLNFPIPPIPSSTIHGWCDGHSALLAKMVSKLRCLPRQHDATAAEDTARVLIEGYLKGQAILGRLRDDYPELSEQILTIKGAREQRLSFESQISTTPPAVRLTDALRDFEARLTQVNDSITPAMASHLVDEAIADWLMRCPLDFAAPTEHA